MSQTIIQRATSRGDIRLERHAANDYRTEIYAPLAGAWSMIEKHPGPATGKAAFQALHRRMSRPPIMKVRIGISSGRQRCREMARELGAPVLVSANTLWDNRRGRFKPWRQFEGLDVALDSGGFVAMRQYGGYRWTTDQYVALAQAMRPTWWAQMDFCCEPEIARDQGTVFRRIDATAQGLYDCIGAAARHGTADPMPVLQGWHPEDYCQGPIYDPGFEWPEVVGVGSVCRRHLHGPDGLLSVIRAIDRKVPSGVRLHLFGVKSQAIAKLLELFPGRIASIDSMAWHMAARWDALHAGIANDEENRAQTMARWYRRQVELVSSSAQLQLSFPN